MHKQRSSVTPRTNDENLNTSRRDKLQQWKAQKVGAKKDVLKKPIINTTAPTEQAAKKRKLNEIKSEGTPTIKENKFTIFQDNSEVVSKQAQQLKDNEQEIQAYKDRIQQLEAIVCEQQHKLDSQNEQLKEQSIVIVHLDSDSIYYSTMLEAAKIDIDALEQEKRVLAKKNLDQNRLNQLLNSKLQENAKENETLQEKAKQAMHLLESSEAAEKIVRDGIYRKAREDQQELRFNNELLMQQLADKQKKNDQDVKNLKRQLQEKEKQAIQQETQWKQIIGDMQEQLQTGLVASMNRIQQLEKELAEK